MLGFGPISSRSISGGPFSLVAVPAALIAATTVTFAVDGRAGLYLPAAATFGLAFDVSAPLSTLQAISGSSSITFGGSFNLRVAGKPIIISAVPISFTVRAPPESYTLKAMSEQFTVRGVR